jgi:phosphoserine phosphatase
MGGARAYNKPIPSQSVMLEPVKQCTAREVWTRIENLALEMPDGVIATDGDGTLWTGDVGEDLFRAFVDQDLVRPAAVDALRRMASVHELSDAGTGQDVARRIYAAYVRGAFPEQRVCEVMTWCYAGLTVEEIRAFAQRVVEDANLPSRIQGEMRYLLDRARSAGIRVVLVSASPTYSVAEAAKRLGLLERDVVAARPRVVDAVIQPELELPIPYGAAKLTRLRETIGPTCPLVAAFGDNAFDVAMLAEARIGVAVRPKPRLRERATEVRGLVELAPEPTAPGAGS